MTVTCSSAILFFFFNDTATTEIYTLSLHDALPISCQWTSVCESSANQSRRSPTDQMPALLIQPPRLVELATSGLTVTTRSATSGASCTRSTKKRPKACCVDSFPRCLRPSAGGGSGGGCSGGC